MYGTRSWPCAPELEPLDMQSARRRLAEREWSLDLAELDDDDVRARLRDLEEHEEHERSRQQHTHERARPHDPIAFSHAIDLRSLLVRHRIAFEVLDGRGKAFPGVPYELRERASTSTRGSIGNDGAVRRDGVDHDDWELVLVEIEAVQWGGDTLEIACSGIADGTTLDVLVFEELRELDDEAVAKLKASVQGGIARVQWQPSPEELAALADDEGRVAFVAEARGPHGTWRKTETPLVLEAPGIVELRFGDASAIDQPVALMLGTRGVADGTSATIEIWRARPGAAPEQLAVLDGIAITGQRAEASWTLAPAADDPLRHDGAECWLVANVDTLRATSPLAFISPA